MRKGSRQQKLRRIANMIKRAETRFGDEARDVTVNVVASSIASGVEAVAFVTFQGILRFTKEREERYSEQDRCMMVSMTS
jgi:peroxiredoxin family protein